MLPQDIRDQIIDAWAMAATLSQSAIRCSGNDTKLTPAELERLLQCTFSMGMTISLISSSPKAQAYPPEQILEYIQGIYLTECGDSTKVFFHTDEA